MAFWFYQCVLAIQLSACADATAWQSVAHLTLPVRVGDPVVGLRRRYSPRKPGGRLPTLRSPIRFGVQFKLVWFYYAQRRAGCLRSSPFPLRGKFFSLPGSGNFFMCVCFIVSSDFLRQRIL
ncbi:MAG: hypothetical protein LBQ66_15975 [Planctomycetaceae bacterium]|nr:hypothetical protein [Planctomycetaceae bacterium]